MITIAALPFALLMLLVMVSLYRVLDQEYTRERRQAQRQRHMIDAWIAREMAAQEETQAEAARARSGLRGFAACGCAFKQRQQQLQKRLWISAGLAVRGRWRDTPQVRPCRLGHGIHAVDGPAIGPLPASDNFR